jgi:SulP family sulfate permease
VLVCSAVNDIDASALDSLDALNGRLRDSDVRLHLSEVKERVMDRLHRSRFLQGLSGRVFQTPYDAFRALAPAACDSRGAEAADNLAGAGI